MPPTLLAQRQLVRLVLVADNRVLRIRFEQRCTFGRRLAHGQVMLLAQHANHGAVFEQANRLDRRVGRAADIATDVSSANNAARHRPMVHLRDDSYRRSAIPHESYVRASVHL